MVPLWGNVRIQVYEKQGGCCAVCGEFLKGDFDIHHIRNKSKGGPATLTNAEARHKKCEREMHAKYKYGNYPRGDDPNVMATLSRRKGKRKKHKR